MLNKISGRIGFFAVLLLSAAAFINIPAFAQDSAVPSETASEDEMKAFAERARDELNKILGGVGTGFEVAGEASLLWRQMRVPDGDWQNGSVYLINVRESVSVEGVGIAEPPGQFQVVSHGKHMKSLFGEYIGAISLMNAEDKNLGDLAKAAKDDPDGNAVCMQYKRNEGGADRWTCAAAYNTPDTYGDVKYVVIAGFDHDETDGAIVKNPCARNALITRDFLPVQAEDVVDKETLQKFVERTAALVTPQVSQETTPDVREAQVAEAVCFSRPPWAHGSIYLFIMEGNVVITNANDPGLNGSVFENVFDEDGVDIWKLIKEAVESEAGGGFVEYKWDNPLTDEDDVPPALGKSPGTSPKISYVKKAELGDGRYVVFGSGIYPAQTPPTPTTTGSDDDGGCAIAGTGDRSRGVLLNFLLTAAVLLFPAALLRKRN